MMTQDYLLRVMTDTLRGMAWGGLRGVLAGLLAGAILGLLLGAVLGGLSTSLTEGIAAFWAATRFMGGALATLGLFAGVVIGGVTGARETIATRSQMRRDSQ